MSTPNNTLDWIAVLLFVGCIMSLGALFLAEKWFPMDGQMFQVVAGLVTAFSGSLFTRLNPRRAQPGDGATSATAIVTPPAPTSAPGGPNA